MAELVDVQDLGSCGAIRVGSSPTTRTKSQEAEGFRPSASFVLTLDFPRLFDARFFAGKMGVRVYAQNYYFEREED